MSAEDITAWSALIAALTGVMWPIIAVGLLIAFRDPVMRALSRISEDGGTVEVFGVKIDVGKATEEQQALIEDLQEQVKLLRGAIGADAKHSASPVTTPPPPPVDNGFGGVVDMYSSTRDPEAPPPRRAHPRLLWVDDYPENNAVLVASLRNRGFEIDQVRSTAEAIAHFAPARYDAVVSDMGRPEGRDAGVALTATIRPEAAIPILIFCSDGGVREFGDRAHAAGANIVTSSATVLMDNLRDLQAA